MDNNESSGKLIFDTALRGSASNEDEIKEEEIETIFSPASINKRLDPKELLNAAVYSLKKIIKKFVLITPELICLQISPTAIVRSLDSPPIAGDCVLKVTNLCDVVEYSVTTWNAALEVINYREPLITNNEEDLKSYFEPVLTDLTCTEEDKEVILFWLSLTKQKSFGS